jgi:hypothetical protein
MYARICRPRWTQQSCRTSHGVPVTFCTFCPKLPFLSLLMVADRRCKPPVMWSTFSFGNWAFGLDASVVPSKSTVGVFHYWKTEASGAHGSLQTRGQRGSYDPTVHTSFPSSTKKRACPVVFNGLLCSLVLGSERTTELFCCRMSIVVFGYRRPEILS